MPKYFKKDGRLDKRYNINKAGPQTPDQKRVSKLCLILFTPFFILNAFFESDSIAAVIAVITTIATIFVVLNEYRSGYRNVGNIIIIMYVLFLLVYFFIF